jgi:uncharacterized repeat protein (TIGR03803 family)
VDPNGNETVLHSFAGGPADGANSYAGLVRDFAGNLYGTTYVGGASDLGIVFGLNSTATETVLHSFAGGATDGANPQAGLIRDFAGNLYGTTLFGGASNNGVVFKLDSAGRITLLHSFVGPPADGLAPAGVLVRDFAGNLYGTTAHGGASGMGMVFKLELTGKETVLHSFAGGSADGSEPAVGLVRDFAGNLYGTAQFGGVFGMGVVFKLDSIGKETVLHSFAGGPTDGSSPIGSLVRDLAGNLYGTTQFGGGGGFGVFGNGVVFKLDPAGKITLLHSFGAGGQTEGAYPADLHSFAGALYGTTGSGGHGFGVVFRLGP